MTTKQKPPKFDKLKEVKFGTSSEDLILQYWLTKTKQAAGVDSFFHTSEFCHFDFVGFTKDFIPILYVEVKRRRIKWGKYGKDVMFPLHKHDFARRLGRNCIGAIGVTGYDCKTVVETDLADAPTRIDDVERRDRPGHKAKHGFWEGDQLIVYPRER